MLNPSINARWVLGDDEVHARAVREFSVEFHRTEMELGLPPVPTPAELGLCEPNPAKKHPSNRVNAPNLLAMGMQAMGSGMDLVAQAEEDQPTTRLERWDAVRSDKKMLAKYMVSA